MPAVARLRASRRVAAFGIVPAMSTIAMGAPQAPGRERHPPGLLQLFFVEMWERFSFYGMRALLVFYLIKDFMKASDERAYAIYGAYGALVYATPFLGGFFADKVIGARAAVIFGGLLMAAGHLVMSVRHEWALFMALALLICGNGFFKPNISTMIGELYPERSAKRDAGFTIFYMGINLGAALAPLICGFVGETYGWHYGFGLATAGMLLGVATFVVPNIVARSLILGASLATVAGMLWLGRDRPLELAINLPVGLALLAAGLIAFVALGHGGLPDHVGRPKEEARRQPGISLGGITLPKSVAIYAGTLLAVPIIAWIVWMRGGTAGYMLSVFGILALGYILYEMLRGTRIERQRLTVVLVLTFFSMLFWAFFEQAGSSVNNFTDRNVDRVVGDQRPVLGRTYEGVVVTQEFLGHDIAGRTWTLADIDRAQKARLEALKSDPVTTVGTVTITIESQRHLHLGVGGTELKASIFQAVNPIYILIFGLPFSFLWGWLGARGRDPSPPVKFSLGLAQLSLGFGAFWLGARQSDEMGMVAVSWLLLGYLLQTTGELCLSPVGLSMVTKITPTRLVSTVMGAWFLATAFSHLLAAAIAKLTQVTGEEGGAESIPPPWETVHVYGDVFGKVAIAAMISAVVLLMIAPLLNRWMHMDKPLAS